MSFPRWTASFLGFPLGGWLAFLLVGSANSPLRAAWAGAVAGAIIGAAQWLALRPSVNWHWVAASTIGMSGGSALAATVTGSATSVSALAVTGTIAGAAVGVAQGLAFRRSWRVTALWAATVSAASTVGWVTTANVIIDADSGYVAFGSSGALVATAVTGLVLRHFLGRRDSLSAFPAASAAVVPSTAVAPPTAGRPATAGPAAGTQR